MSQHVPKGYKKWCENCKLMIAANEMNQHLKSRMHLKNKQRDLDWSQQKHRKMRQEEEKQGKQNQIIQEIEKKAKLAMANYDKDYKKAQKILNDDEEGNMDHAIRKSYEPGNFMDKADYSQTLSYRDGNQDFIMPGKENLDKQLGKVWNLIRCDETGKLCFYNTISDQKSYTKPMGLKLSEFEEQQWNAFIEEQQNEENDEEEDEDDQQEESDDSALQDLLLKEGIIDEKKEKNEKPKEQKKNKNEEIGMIQGQWEVVEEEDNFYNKYKAEDSPDSEEYANQILGEKDKKSNNQNNNNEDEEQQNAGDIIDNSENEEEETELEKMQREINEGKQISEKEMIEAIIRDQVQDEQGELNKTKLQNENLKKMVEKNFELPSQLQKATFKKKDFVNGDGEDEEIKKIEKKGFKKRVLNNKKTKKLAFDD